MMCQHFLDTLLKMFLIYINKSKMVKGVKKQFETELSISLSGIPHRHQQLSCANVISADFI